MPNNDEKRRFLREQAAFQLVYSIKAPLSAINEFGSAEHNATASNLSEEGLRLFTDFELPIGAVLLLKFRLMKSTGALTEEHSRKMELEAEVRYSSHAVVKAAFFVGIHFMHLSDSDRAFIVAAIAG